ncbi:hypothetical protein [Micromonospora tulbaghiae]|nr:hypothetical protein [Micromonospora tulbaghiae]
MAASTAPDPTTSPNWRPALDLARRARGYRVVADEPVPGGLLA